MALSLVVILIGLIAAFKSASTKQAVAADDSENGQAVQSAVYSTTKSGSKLKWLPQRPAADAETPSVVATGYTSPSSQPRRLRTAQRPTPANNGYSNPFKEKKPAPAQKLTDDALSPQPTPAVKKKAAEPLPSLGAEDPAAAEKPYVPADTLKPLNPKAVSADRGPGSVHLREFKEDCPSPKNLKHISDLTTNITPSEGDLPHDCPLTGVPFKPRSFESTTYTWMASGLCHKPLYFEDVQLERYGHMGGPLVQPVASFAHFFATFPILPYKMGLETPNECMYSLGYYRPGDCAPYLFDPIPISTRGALFEAGAWVGAVAILP